MKTIVAAAAVVAMICGTGVAMALGSSAELKLVEGPVLVNNGQSYRTAVVGTTLDAGDRLMIMEGGSAVVVYSDGCRSDYQENQIVTILRDSPCYGGIGDTRIRGEDYVSPMAAGGGPAVGRSTVSSAAMFAGMAVTFGVTSKMVHDSNKPISGE